MVNVRKDLTGYTFGMLTVLEQAEDHIQPNGKHMAMWLCECSCEEHNRVIVSGQCLKNGNTKSCGCIQKDIVHKIGKKNKKSNNYYYKEDTVYIKCYNEDVEFLISTIDLPIVLQFCWVFDKSNGYIVARESDTGKKVYLHKLLCSTDNVVDHKNRNKLDNRRENLRIATNQQNNINQSIRNDNTSGIIGVRWNEKVKKWHVQIQIDNKNMYIGIYTNKEDAIIARLKAELKYFGNDFAPQRHLFNKYGISLDKQEDL